MLLGYNGISLDNRISNFDNISKLYYIDIIFIIIINN